MQFTTLTTLFCALVLTALTANAAAIDKRDTTTNLATMTVDQDQFLSMITASVSVSATNAAVTINVAVPVVVTPGVGVQAMATQLAAGMQDFVFDVERRMLPSGLSAVTAIHSSTPILEVIAPTTTITLANGPGPVSTAVVGNMPFFAAVPNGAMGSPRRAFVGVLGTLGLIAGGAAMVL
ncbi:uncharacterized protein BXZ73DRAFT_78435 [Epithele typhae]|uniref:uncharacterized protein n=1 Tax=Epithele typhae TaxID=378194 RepID=UPI002007909C|nr:uncharacterized protein BXZ73DRAFT_78435 [Epithele typhae]KAH9927993.1 hypothetical protein BXZ73DRAFT_78435 [Epithele typhae]